MKPEFLVEKNGKKMVLYAGLLDEAHQQGLVGIMVDIIQTPDADNAHVAICRATVTMQDGEGETARTKIYTEIGDASPDNVARPMTICLLRMAATRAKARALRDAINVGVTSMEEMPEDAPAPRPSQPRPQQRPPAPRSNNTPAAPPSDPNVAEPASDAQKRMIETLCGQQHMAPPDMASMTRQSAHELIKRLKGESSDPAPATPTPAQTLKPGEIAETLKAEEASLKAWLFNTLHWTGKDIAEEFSTVITARSPVDRLSQLRAWRAELEDAQAEAMGAA